MKKTVVFALGGNALLRAGQKGTIADQRKNAEDTLVHLLDYVKNDAGVVITHGNGPQVGNILLRNEAGNQNYSIPKMPLDVCVADSQGGIGYMLEHSLRNLFKKHGINKKVVSLISPVRVSKKDPAFKDPSKPVGPFFLKEEADLMATANGWTFREDPRKRGWRRVVPSPMPAEIMNAETIRELTGMGYVVIAAGGGGIPVIKKKDGTLEGVEAVIDKDLASALLGAEIGAEEFYILTDVPKVYLNFGKPDQKALDLISANDAQEMLKDGVFPAGSMGPKIQACVNFVKGGGELAVITESTRLNDPDTGTKIYQSEDFYGGQYEGQGPGINSGLIF